MKKRCTPFDTAMTLALASALLASTAWGAAQGLMQMTADVPFAQSIRAGVALARACEPELDDDLGSYEECAFHQVRRLKDPGAQVGFHWQIWSMAELAQRSGANRAEIVARDHQHALLKALPAQDPRWQAVCEVLGVSCAQQHERLATAQRFKE
jgi:hypothetical protein